MTAEKFCLRWNDFEGNISAAFKELREEKDFFDITLVCEDEQIQAHKVILSACSPFFRTTLRRNPHQHPLLYLKGVTFNDLKSVLDFMYYGEVNVAQEELNSFLAVAEDLRVKGLTQAESQQGTKSVGKQKTSELIRQKGREMQQPHQQHEEAPLISPRKAHQISTTQEDDVLEVTQEQPIKSEPREASLLYSSSQSQAPPSHPVEHSLETYQEEGLGYEDYSHYEEQAGYGSNGDQYSIHDKGNKHQICVMSSMCGHSDPKSKIHLAIHKQLKTLHETYCIHKTMSQKYLTDFFYGIFLVIQVLVRPKIGIISFGLIIFGFQNYH